MKTYGENSIQLLNVGVDAFYSYQVDFIDESKVIEFKAMLITFINQLERVFNGVFGKTFRLDDQTDIELFKDLFPVMHKAATKYHGSEGLHKLCSTLSYFRNINAHAYCNCDFANDLDCKYILENLPNFNPRIRYWTESNIPTLAGMMTLLFFLANDKCTKLFVRSDIWKGFIEELNYFSNDYVPDLFSFHEMVMKVNQINDEIEIRKESQGNTVLTAITGRFFEKLTSDGEFYHYQNGMEFEDSSFHIDFCIKEKPNGTKLIVKKASNYHFYFTEDYELTINDVDSFKEWSDKLPPFMFVVFLYRAKITNYTKDSLNETLKEYALKLNKPKFYVDKNIDTLLLTNKISDIRMGGQAIASPINYCLYRFELAIFKRRTIHYNKFSSFRQSLESVKAPMELIERLVAIRNFFSHYHLLGDVHVVGKGFAKIDLDFIILAFRDFVDYLREYDEYKAKSVSNDFFYRVICSMLLFKYSDLMKKSKSFIDCPSDSTYEAICKTINRVNNSFITIDTERLIKKIYPDRRFTVFKDEMLYINKCVVVSDKNVEFKNGFVCKSPISLVTTFNIKPYQYIDAASLVLKSEVKDGFCNIREWKVED